MANMNPRGGPATSAIADSIAPSISVQAWVARLAFRSMLFSCSMSRSASDWGPARWPCALALASALSCPA